MSTLVLFGAVAAVLYSMVPCIVIGLAADKKLLLRQ